MYNKINLIERSWRKDFQSTVMAKKTKENNSNNKRTVVLIGRTGNGKSTCANVIAGCNSDDPEQQLFRESDGADSEMRDIIQKMVRVTWNKTVYDLNIVDTIGLGDTSLSEEQVLKRLAKVCYMCKEGLNAVFFLISGRPTKQDAYAWDIISRVIFTPEICKWTTIIRTKFPQFMNPERVSADMAVLKRNKPGYRVTSMVKKVLHIDNPSLLYTFGQETRAKSRDMLLAEIALSDQVYKPVELDQVNERISTYMEKQSEADKKTES